MIETYIRPHRGWISFEWRELWEFRDLVWLLIRRDLVAKYKQTVLGPLWFILQPLLTTVVFTIVFGNFAELSTDGLPKFLFYLCGMLGWTYFATNLNAIGTTFTSNAHLFGKVYFPRLAVPLATSVSNLAAFVIQLITFLAFWLYFKLGTAAGAQFTLNWQIVFLPLLVLQTMALSLGASLWMSALSAKYRDFAHMMGFLTQIWMYGTPIVYPLSLVPEKWRWLIELNPMTVITEWFRLMFLGRGTVTPLNYAVSLAITAFLFVTGLLVFQKVGRRFVDTV